ncbi:DapH/DapD/GlmU-related protein [Pseudomonas taiwanensis]|uniref:Acyltransferase n=1 Tax=Pseudomonas taiwanensis TaxID=470150 RepID=A0ABR6V710_9PSED|nr:DapH/DapD/GlmU-related protein [Pseudomonas taiwanensis]MBC3476310.1 acyltransferase [Pseudomonas taiwanensis]MBC3494000.1 acyltransferase [Pseudomonas taiwanensis]
MMWKLLVRFKGILRAFFIFFACLRRRALFYPFASVSASGGIDIEAGVSVKRVRLNAVEGGITLCSGVWLNDAVEVNSTNSVVIGRGTTVQRNVTINGEVSIGEECLLAPNVFISSTSHAHDYLPGVGIREQERRMSKEEFLARYNRPVSIGNDVWLGANVVVMPGVRIGSHVVVGANSVVNIDIPSGVIAAGVPVRVLKKRVGFDGGSEAGPA